MKAVAEAVHSPYTSSYYGDGEITVRGTEREEVAGDQEGNLLSSPSASMDPSLPSYALTHDKSNNNEVEGCVLKFPN